MTNKPIQCNLKAGERKAFCTCAKTDRTPFCDGSHAGTDKRPEIVTAQEDKTVFACGCGKSANMPYCDGSHKGL